MRIVLSALLSLMLAVAPTASAGAAEADPVETRLAETIDGYVRNRGFNGVVLVANADGVIVHQARGQASLELGTPLAPDAVFRIGSLTKPLTAVLVLSLVHDGRLRLDGSLGEYLPELYADTPAGAVTVEQLLAHTSGLKDLPGSYYDPFWQTTARQTFTPDAFARAWIPPELSSPPGQMRYNNNGFYLLGMIVERVTGTPYADALRDRVLAPARMTQSGVYDPRTVVPHLASGYARSDFGVMDRPMPVDPTVSYAAAGAFSTAQDLLAFSRALSGDRLLPTDLKARMFTQDADEYGLGWGVERWPTTGTDRMTVQTHTGSIPGYQSLFTRADDGTVVVILNNFWQGATTVEMGRALFAVVHGAPAPAPKRLLGDLLTPLAARDDVDAMEAAFRAAPTDGTEAYDVSERALNTLGYSLMRKGFREAAIRVFEWNVAAHPQSANVHDSLGEAYLGAGRRDEARRSYENALRLDPSSTSARAALAGL
ncbi:MAG: serine hydrolase [Caulobacteraceae bacterium]|nr:serine hydrolase [Caulobacteraceae bacterium]